MNMKKLSQCLALCAALAASPAFGQAKVLVLVKNLQPLTPNTSEVLVVRLGSYDPESVEPGMPLGIGDELRGITGAVKVQLRCGAGTLVTLSERFRVVISPPVGKDCTINLMSGAAHLLSDSDKGTEVQVGETSFASERTEYEVRFGSDGRSEAIVYGDWVNAISLARSRRLDQGFKLRAGSDDAEKLEVADIERTADLHAQVEVAKVMTVQAFQNPTAVYEALVENHRQVLANPSQPAIRLALAEKQLQYSLPAEAAYQSGLAVEMARQTGDRRLQATALLTLSTAYEKTGDAPRAERLRLDAVRIDPELQRRPRPQRYLRDDVQMVLQAALRSEPPQAGPGERVRLTVTVTAGGRPVEGADVRLGAGGGAFARGGTEITGQTDAQGIFSISWGCQPCAPAYEITAEVSKSGFSPARASVVVRIGS